jgi:flagellar export protein FliJ
MATTFRFRLEHLLGIRRQKEDLLQRDLAAAQRAVAERHQSIGFLLAQQEQAKVDVRAAQDRAIDMGRLKLADEYLSALGRLVRREQETLHDLVKIELERRQELVEARKAVRVLERFRERQVRRQLRELDLEERKFLDDVGQNLAKGA